MPTALEHISTFYVTPGGSSERIFLYYGEIEAGSRKSSSGGQKVEHEDIEVLDFSPEELFTKLEQGEIDDAKTIIGIMWLRHRLEGRF